MTKFMVRGYLGVDSTKVNPPFFLDFNRTWSGILNEIVEDPVCHMQVPSSSFATEYSGMHYAFCSAQCNERFLSHPHLYVGVPGHKAPAQHGREVIKRRHFVLSIPFEVMQAEQVKRALFEMMGIKKVGIEGDKIEIQYDLIQVTAGQIADKFALTGTDLGKGWKDRFKMALINYLEECEIDSLEVENKKGCH